MCKASGEPGGPQRCRGDARRHYQQSSAEAIAVAALPDQTRIELSARTTEILESHRGDVSTGELTAMRDSARQLALAVSRSPEAPADLRATARELLARLEHTAPATAVVATVTPALLTAVDALRRGVDRLDRRNERCTLSTTAGVYFTELDAVPPGSPFPPGLAAARERLAEVVDYEARLGRGCRILPAARAVLFSVAVRRDVGVDTSAVRVRETEDRRARETPDSVDSVAGQADTGGLA